MFDRIRKKGQALRARLWPSKAECSALRDKVARLEAEHVRARSPFFHYHAIFDPQEIIRRRAAVGLKARRGYLTNFLGVLVDPKFYPPLLAERAGQIEEIPIPANWHADIAEWGAALRAVDLSRETFTVVELGCGWGCWLNNTGVAAKRAGLGVCLIGVEADRGHLGFAREACAANGFRDSEITLIRGIASARSGIALFPRQENAGHNWGLEPIFDADERQRHEAVISGRFEEVPTISLADIAAPHSRIDLLHIDIQGGEADFIRDNLPTLCEKFAYVVIGTHSRQIEGRLFDILLKAGWLLEIERPAILSIGQDIGIAIDGVQGWRNSRICAATERDQ